MTEPWDRFTAIVEEAHDTPDGVKGLLRVTGYRGEEPSHAQAGVVSQMRGGRILTLTARNVGDLERGLRGG